MRINDSVSRVAILPILAFAAFTAEARGDCFLQADTNLDGYQSTEDVGSFVACLVNKDPFAECACADINEDGILNSLDINLFIVCLEQEPQRRVNMWLTTVNQGPNLLSTWKFGVDNFPSIPAGFFDPQSDPWSGILDCRGIPINLQAPSGHADTVVTHEPFLWIPNPNGTEPPEVPAVYTVSADLMMVTEEATSPIPVTYNGGQYTEYWHVGMVLSPTHPGGGQITVTNLDASGEAGTCAISIAVTGEFTFEALPPAPYRKRVLTSDYEVLSETEHRFVRTPTIHSIRNYRIDPVAIGNFVPCIERGVGGNDIVQARCSDNDRVQHCFTLPSTKEGAIRDFLPRS